MGIIHGHMTIDGYNARSGLGSEEQHDGCYSHTGHDITESSACPPDGFVSTVTVQECEVELDVVDKVGI